MEKSKNLNDGIPPASDARWEGVARPLLALLRRRDTAIDEVVAWGKENHHSVTLTKNLLAWLSWKGLAECAPGSRVWRATWTRTKES